MNEIPSSIDVPEFVPCPHQPGWYWTPHSGDHTTNFLRVVPPSTPDALSLELELLGVFIWAGHPEDAFPLEGSEDLYRARLNLRWNGDMDLSLGHSPQLIPCFGEPERTIAFAQGLLGAQRFGRARQRANGLLDE